MGRQYDTFTGAIDNSITRLMDLGHQVKPKRWQGYETGDDPSLVTKELINLQFEVPMEREFRGRPWIEDIAQEIKPNLPWADLEFNDRVGGVPQNPHSSLEHWPWWRGQSDETMEEGKFSHTYSERFWPKNAPAHPSDQSLGRITNHGIRYDYGDLNDVLGLLFEDPFTRQATFPIFFPEDTGCVHRGRIPCTLHYHFLLRDNRLHLWYPIRSCDAVRHFRDDLYLAARLCGWVIFELSKLEDGAEDDRSWLYVQPGTLFFTAYSFHVHMGDYHLLEAR